MNTIFRLFVLFPVYMVLSLTVASQTSNDSLLSFQSIFDTSLKPDVSCFRIPAIVTAPNGDLIAAIDERVPSCADLNGSKDINIVMRRSSDNGNSWSEMQTVVDYPLGQSASDPSMIVDKIIGDIFLFFNFMDHNKEKDVYYLRVTKSSDNGKTWGTPRDITKDITKPEWHNDFKFITSGRGIQTQSGKLLHTLVNLQRGLHLFYSDDHGETWKLIDTSIQPGDESKVVELADCTWMVNSRVKGIGMRYVHTSIDQGKTWVSRPDSSLTDPACNASIIRYSSVADGSDKNRLLFSNANNSKDRKNMTVRISYDEGKSWSEGKTIYAGSSAYSSLTVLPNGEVVLFFEKDDYTQNVVTRFSLDWLTNGKDAGLKPDR